MWSHWQTGILWKKCWSQNSIYTVPLFLRCVCVLLEVKIIINVQISDLFYQLSCVWISQGKWKRHTPCTAANKTAQFSPALGYRNISQNAGSPQNNTPTMCLCLFLTYHSLRRIGEKRAVSSFISNMHKTYAICYWIIYVSTSVNPSTSESSADGRKINIILCD